MNKITLKQVLIGIGIAVAAIGAIQIVVTLFQFEGSKIFAGILEVVVGAGLAAIVDSEMAD